MASLTGKTPAQTYMDLLQVSNSNSGVDGTLRKIEDGGGTESVASLSTNQLKLQPTADGDVFEVVDAAGSSILKINTSTKVITAGNTVKFSGDGSLLTGVTSVGTGGTTATDNLEVQANSDSSGGGDIINKVGATVVTRVKGNAAATQGIFELTETAAGSSFVTPTVGSTGIGQKAKELYKVDDTGKVSQLVSADDWTNLGEGGLAFLAGSSQKLTLPNDANINFGTSDFSLEFSFKYDALPASTGWLFAKGAAGGGAGYSLYINNSGNLCVSMKDSAGEVNLTAPVLSAGTNYHLVLSFDRDSNLNIYVNGVYFAGTSIAARQLSVDSSIQPTFAVYSSSSFLSCSIYMARLYNRAISQSEAIKLYNNGRPFMSRLTLADLNGTMVNKFTNYSGGTISSVTATGFTLAYTGGSGAVNVAAIVSGGIAYSPYFNRKARCTFTVTVNSGTFTTATVKTFSCGGTSLTMAAGSNLWELSNSNGTSGAYFSFNSADSFNITISNISFIELGCVAEFRGENAGKAGWLETMNNIHGNTSNAPIAINAEHKVLVYKDVKTYISNTSTALTDLIPPGYRITSIRAKGTASLTGIKIGTSVAGEQIVASTTASTTASLLTLAATNPYSETANTTVYVEHATSGQTLDLIFKLEKIN